jgi:glycine cleavage system regulatory protein
MTTIVITVIGDDKAGLVEALSGVIADHGGNWDRSHMSELAGKFAGIVMVTIGDAKSGPLLADLEKLESAGLLHVTAEATTQSSSHGSVEPPSSSPDSLGPVDELRHLALTVYGPDHPGIVHELSHTLAENGLSIEELVTEVVPAPMGGHLFKATARVSGQAGVSLPDLHDELERAAPEMVLEIAETPPADQ